MFKLGWIVVFMIAAWLMFSPWGAIRYYRVSQKLENLAVTNRELRQKNRLLEKEIDLLSKDPAYIEKVAREKYGLLRKNEFVYEFPEK